MKKFIAILLLVTSCNIAVGQDKSIKESDLIGCWTHYPEENKFYEGIDVYRPCNYKSFLAKPIARRSPPFTMKLMKNGKSRFLQIGPTDIPSWKDCKWTYNSDTGLLKIISLEGNLIKSLKIGRLENKLLGVNKN